MVFIPSYISTEFLSIIAFSLNNFFNSSYRNSQAFIYLEVSFAFIFYKHEKPLFT